MEEFSLKAVQLLWTLFQNSSAEAVNWAHQIGIFRTCPPHMCTLIKLLGDSGAPWGLRRTEANLAWWLLGGFRPSLICVLFNQPLLNGWCVPRHYRGYRGELKLPSSEICSHIMKWWQCNVVTSWNISPKKRSKVTGPIRMLFPWRWRLSWF